jgi:hypothetical protein
MAHRLLQAKMSLIYWVGNNQTQKALASRPSLNGVGLHVEQKTPRKKRQ